MWFVIFQGISQPLNGKGLHETFAVENFLVVMALCTVLTCLPVMPVNSARRGECWLHLSWAYPSHFSELNRVLVYTRTPCYIANMLGDFCHSLLSRWTRGNAAQMRMKESCSQTLLHLIYKEKKKKPETDRTVPFFWHQQNYPREMRTDLGLLSSGASIMKSKSYKNERMYFKAPSCCHRECKDHLPALALPLYGDRGGGWCGKVDCGEHFSRLSCLQYESATGNGGE